MAIDDRSAPPPPLRIGLPSRLGEMLIRQGLVTSEDVQAALAEQAAGSEWRLGRLLVRRGALDDRTLVQAIAHQFHVQVVDLRFESPVPRALDRLGRTAALQLQALPLRLDADALVVAVADPPVRELRVAVERCTGLPVRLVLAPADELADALEHWYGEGTDVVATAEEAGAAAAEPWLVSTREPVPEAVHAPAAGPEPVVEPVTEPEPEPTAATGDPTDLQIVVWLITEAVRRDATAAHLDHSEDGLRVRYRVDGRLVAGPTLPRASGTVVCHRLLAAAQLDPADDGLHEGAFDTVVDGASVTCRVTAVTTSSGTHVVVRTEASARPGRLEDLRIGANDAAALRRVVEEGRGVVVVASTAPGPAGEVCRVLVDEVGADDHVVVTVSRAGGATMRGAVVLGPDAASSAPVVHTARALGADALVIDAADVGISRAAFDAASELLVVLQVVGQDPSEVAAGLVEQVGGFLVAGMLRAVVVASPDPRDPAAEVHLVTEDVCRAILELPPTDSPD